MSCGRTDSIVQVLEASAGPIYLLDPDRNLVYCNRKLACWTGVEAAELVGRRVDYHSRGSLADAPGVAAGLCPPPKAFAGEETSGHVSCMSRDGRLLHRRATFIPLIAAGRADGSAAVIVVVDPVDLDAAALAADVEGQTPDALHWTIRRFRAKQADRYGLDRLVGTSPAIGRARAQVALAAASTASVLVVGPVGSGRSFVARAIHYLGDPSRTARLIPLDCSVLSGAAMRQAIAALAGSDQQDAAGTLWLQEVDRLPMDHQQQAVELLRGAAGPYRLIATTQHDLAALVVEQAFREDLRCALATVTIELPPLAQRQDDLALLAQVFLEDINREGGKQIGGISAEALDLLAMYPWPAGLDELAEAIRAAHASASGPEIGPHDLPAAVQQIADVAAFPPRQDETIVLDELLGRIERELINRAMARAKGNKTKTALLLGMTRPRLYRRLVQLGLAEKKG